MRRFLLLVALLLSVPLQYSWAALGAYCEHEENAAQWHFGHHVHIHSKDDQGPAKPLSHGDCASCQYGGAGIAEQQRCADSLAAYSASVPFEPPFLLNDVSSEPERPNWAAAG